MKLTKYITMAGLFLMVACSEPLKVEPLTYTQIFSGKTKKTWTIRSIQQIQNGKGTQTFTLNPCIYDDQYVFNNDFNKTYQVLDGANKCSASDPNVLVDSNWSFVNATSTLTIVMPLLSESPLPFIVKSIDNTKMTIDIYIDDQRTSAYRFNFKSAAGG
ncbi:MAG TPA: hypothetical protein VF473_11190 [Cyclobacteriaceae bacterium]